MNLFILTIALEGLFFMSPPEEAHEDGYRGIARYGNDFVAVGSEGRIDRISLSGELIQTGKFIGVNFNCVSSDDEMIIAAGNNGTIVFSTDGTTYTKAESCTDKDINSIAYFKKTIIAGADHGEIITGDPQGPLQRIIPGVKGNIVSVSAGSSGCYGVTDEGEIIQSSDGISWEIFDLNRVYSGYYKPVRFSRVLVTEDRILLTGLRDDGSPLLMFSSLGKVWTDRTLNYTDEGEMQGSLCDQPNDIFYDKANDEFFIACSKGKLMMLPSCPHCNRLAVLTEEDLTGISSAGNTLIVVGSNFFVKTLNIR